MTIDAIMHLIFLGLVKSLVLLIMEWFALYGLDAEFRRRQEKILEPLRKMGLDWLNVMLYKGEKLGGWVSENYLGFSRIMVWFYQNIDQLPRTNQQINAPPDGLPQKNWTKKHNEHWLRSRGIKYDNKAKAKDLEKMVAGYLAKPEAEIPKATPVPERNEEDVLEPLLATGILLQCVMSPVVTADLVMRTRYAVRRVLTAFDKLASITRYKVEKKPAIIGIYNMQCL